MFKSLTILLSIILLGINCKENAIFRFLKTFLQSYVDNDLFIKVMEWVRRNEQHKFPDNFENNMLAFQNHLARINQTNGFIEKQESFWDMKYGAYNLSENGCGLIATYNVLHDLTGKDYINFPLIIDSLEKDGIILSGLFGTSMVAIEEYFKKNGFKTKFSTKKENYDKLGEECDALILTIYNNKKNILEAIHTFAITKKDGKFYLHNQKSSYLGSNAFNSITDILLKINSGLAKDISLIGIIKN